MKKLGIYAGINYPIPIEERIAAIKSAGFNVICLDFEKDMEKTETSWENQVNLANKYSLPILEAHLTGSNMTSIWDENDSEEAKFVTERLINELKDLSKLSIPTGIAHITWGYKAPKAPSDKALNRFMRITEAAEKYKVKLALENSVFEEQVRFVLCNIKSDYLGFCYDSGHENAFTPNANYLDSFGERLFSMHLHDNNGIKDNHYPPFHKDGTVNWEKVAEKLKKTELFSKYVVIEAGKQEESFEKLLEESYKAAVKLAIM